MTKEEERIKKQIYETTGFINKSLKADNLSHCEYYRDLMAHLLNRLINEKNKEVIC